MIVRMNALVTARLYAGRELVETRQATNFLTELGEAYVADRLSDRDHADGAIDYMAIGEGSGRDRTATTLATEVARVALDGGYPDQGSGESDNDVIWQATYPTSTPATDKTITEGGLFSLVSGGVLVNYFEFSPGIFKATTMTLVITLTWTIGAS